MAQIAVLSALVGAVAALAGGIGWLGAGPLPAAHRAGAAGDGDGGGLRGRAAAAHALACWPDWTPGGALPALRRAARDPCPEMRAAAIAGLGYLYARAEGTLRPISGSKQREALAPIAAGLSDSDRDVRSAAASALQTVWLTPTTPYLREALESRYPDVRVAALQALGRAGRCDNALWNATRDPDPGVHRAACRALSHVWSRDAGPALAGLVRDLRPEVRAAAAVALGRGASLAAPALLAPLLRDRDAGVGDAARWGLVLSHQPAAARLLIGELRSSDPAVRRHAAAALASWDRVATVSLALRPLPRCLRTPRNAHKGLGYRSPPAAGAVLGAIERPRSGRGTPGHD